MQAQHHRLIRIAGQLESQLGRQILDPDPLGVSSHAKGNALDDGQYECLDPISSLDHAGDQLAHDGASAWKIREAACEEGMRSVRDDGWQKVLDGRTSIEEIVRVTKGEYRVK